MIKRIFTTTLVFLVLIGTLSPVSTAQNEEKKQMPPASVVVSKVTRGEIAPEQEFIGSVYYVEVSDLSVEVSGLVEIVNFEEGHRTKKGDVLVRLDTNLLEKKLQARVALYEQTLSDLEGARIDFERINTLYKKRVVAEKLYHDEWYQVKNLEKKADALKAEVEQLEIELKKTLIKAPFSGVIIKKHIARGEWLSPGKTVATIARDDAIDFIVEAPEEVTRYLRPGMAVSAAAAGRQMRGIITAIIPRSDITTRTFPIKIRVKNSSSLLEGMEARVRLPIGKKIDTLLVPRDAVLTKFGTTVVVAVVESKAVIIPTRVVGYQGMKAGINAKKVLEGMKVVVKGNERLTNGQSVIIIREVE
ncbi:MAG: efflux RND transporter periplasmic adaptor subunit [Pseudomonadota bacterium]